MVIYADVVLFVNSMFNATVLVLLHMLQSRKIRLFRLIVSAFLGGGLSMVCFVPYFQPYLSAAARYILPFVMGMICFMPCDVKSVIISGMTIYILSFFVSGMMNFFGIKGVIGVYGLIPVFYVLTKFRGRFKKQHKETVLKYGGKTIRVNGFCDSGNLLTYGGVPVILADKNVFEMLFGTAFGIDAVWEWIDKRDLRYISYSALGRSGVIPGIVLDSAIVEGRVFENAILGYMGNDFSEKVILNSIMI